MDEKALFPAENVPARLLALDPSRPVEWVEVVARWLHEASATPLPGAEESRRTARLRALLSRLEGDASASGLRDAAGALLSLPSAVRLVAETGLPDYPSLAKEALHRMADRFLPAPHDPGDLYAIVAANQPGEEDATWVEGLPDDLCTGLASLLGPGTETFRVAALLTAQRAAAVGLARDFLGLEPDGREGDSPFLSLSHRTQELSLDRSDPAREAAFFDCVSRCRGRLAKALSRLEERGANSDLIFRLDLLEALLDRLVVLVRLAAPGAGHADGRAFAAELFRGALRQKSLSGIFRSSMQRLARKVVEHTGETGEHYVSRSRGEYREAFVAASGGGALTALTAAFKFGLHALPFAPFFEGIAYSLNYAVSFVALQLTGLTLASKQPAMTASALAASLEEARDTGRVVAMTAAIVRTQTIVTVGNLFLALPAGLLLDGLWYLVFGAPMLSPETAAHSVESFHPFRTWTLLYAALTGVLLWIGSLVAGLVANWSAFRRVPDGIRTSPALRRLLGPRRAGAVGRFAEHDLGGLAGNVALGFLLGFTPAFLGFFGVGFEVRHVTLSAASVGISVGREVATGTFVWGPFLWAVAGILLIGVFNILVSFGLALATAARARGLDPAMRGRVGEALWKAFKDDPKVFLLPPRDAVS